MSSCLFFKTLGQGNKRLEKLSGAKTKQQEERFAANKVNWQKVSNMIGYK